MDDADWEVVLTSRKPKIVHLVDKDVSDEKRLTQFVYIEMLVLVWIVLAHRIGQLVLRKGIG